PAWGYLLDTGRCSSTRGRTRTGTAFRPGDFLPTSAFAAPRGFVVWSTPSPWPCGFRCPPSALYTFPCGLGSAFARTSRPGRSPSLTGFTSSISRRGLNFHKSPASTISPPGQAPCYARRPAPAALLRALGMTSTFQLFTSYDFPRFGGCHAHPHRYLSRGARVPGERDFPPLVRQRDLLERR